MTPLAAIADGLVLKTVPNVPIVSTGTYHLAGNPYPGGETTFTKEDLADAVAAIDDPAVKLPRLKLGHTSDWGDAEPAFGKVDNLRLADKGHTIVGDYVGTPAWLAEVLPAVYPNRSIEALFNVKTPTGKEYRMVITAVALLGIQLPGVATLEDLAGLYTEVMPEGTEIESAEEVAASLNPEEEDRVRIGRRRKADAAGVNLEDVRRSFYDNIAIGDQYHWWIREFFIEPPEIIVDDDDGNLYRMSYSVADDGEVEFGDPEDVQVEYVAAGLDEPIKRASAKMAFASRSESRPETTREENDMDLKEIRERLGLSEDASEEDVRQALDEAKARVQPGAESGGPGEEETDDDSSEGGDGDEGGEEQPEESEQPEGVAAGTVMADGQALAQLRQDAALGRKVYEERQKEIRDNTISAAIKDGRFPKSRREHYETLWAADPDGTKTLIESLAPGTVPVEQRSEAGEHEVMGGSSDAYDPSWLTPAERARAQGQVQAGPGTIHQEVS